MLICGYSAGDANWIWWSAGKQVARIVPIHNRVDMRLPKAQGFGPTRQKLGLPTDFADEVSLVSIAFQQWQQLQDRAI